MDAFTKGYVACALWLLDEHPPSGDYEGNELYTLNDLHESTLESIKLDCARFQADNAEMLNRVYDASGEEHEVLNPFTDQTFTRPYEFYDAERAGHDFWLSRNGHGAGFFDRDIPCAEELQEAARKFGNVDLYPGDDGKVYA